MTLGEKQEMFTEMWAMLILYARYAGYSIRHGDSFRDERVHGAWGETKPGSYSSANSVHKLKLACDANLTEDGVYLEGEAAFYAHSMLHDFWDLMGGAQRIDDDMNHYSVEHEGCW
jgi:hypothetical protein